MAVSRRHGRKLSVLAAVKHQWVHVVISTEVVYAEDDDVVVADLDLGFDARFQPSRCLLDEDSAFAGLSPVNVDEPIGGTGSQLTAVPDLLGAKHTDTYP
jgi:hypothetical protein